ncbi:MAG TPA: hypothetical protein ENK55_04875 [Actinobacteria bacterium]|nr:hypothetical protein [Actinomycetota bacterium]
METFLALLAAVAATGFAAELFRSWRSRPRAHAGMWSLAMGAYALATWALFVGLAAGWSPAVFRTFYYLGAIVNIPFLAAGSVFLVVGPRAGRRFLTVAAVWALLGLGAVVVAPTAHRIEPGTLPEGSELFPFVVAVGGLSLPGPRLFAAVSGAVGTLVIVGLAAWSAVRFFSSNRRLALGNLLIVAGTLAPAVGGTSTALGEAGFFALSLLVGAVLLWSGYRVASSAPRSLTGRTEPVASAEPGR